MADCLIRLAPTKLAEDADALAAGKLEEQLKTASELLRVCRPGGRIVIVNHFLSRNPLKAALEKLLTPLSVHVGFRLDTPLASVLGEPALKLEMSKRVNLFGNWTLLRLRKAPPTQ